MTYTVILQPSGHRYELDSGETVLDGALRHGLILPYGCRDGACGSCAGKLISGTIDYPGDAPSGLADIDRNTHALFCSAVATSDIVIEVREVVQSGDIQPHKFPCRVAKIDHLANDVIRLYLKLPSSERLQFLAGQYIDFLLRDGRRRAFSIANAPHNDEFIELHIRHVDGGEFTGFVFEQMKEKAIQRIEGPFGSFFLREDTDRPVVLMGGGTGFAPLKGIIEHALQLDVQRPMHLFWGVRTRADLYLPDLPPAWANDHDEFLYTPVLSEPEGNDWTGATGWVHESVAAAYPDLRGHDVYMSGPPPMIEAAKTLFFALGLPDDRLFYDSFEYAADSQKD
ncbi:MAG TPA: CDP-6-deoxy-delta-3,4-glucoseen reductase [Chromatiales bacterium]|jgi:CDP-4-dehydro-6-deoxyglucose reductase|nr:CDP-6-deoxy-delta-3,4-glucoseen reductase [Chromatiaceae bacterium]HIO55056.1 CDP-6-deoxy-delta-3,4-glucoseen reductase [Chromatiales bacterium]